MVLRTFWQPRELQWNFVNNLDSFLKIEKGSQNLGFFQSTDRQTSGFALAIGDTCTAMLVKKHMTTNNLKSRKWAL